MHRAACRQLAERGIDAVHAFDIRLAAASDAALLDRATAEGRIVVTRNYRHFVPLVRACVREGRSFPGVLFLSPAIAPSDPGGHVRALEAWIEGCPENSHPLANTYGWLAAVPADDDPAVTFP